MTSLSSTKNKIRYCGGIYSINEYNSIRVSFGYLSTLNPDEAKKYSLSDWNASVIYIFPKEWVEYITKLELYPYIHQFHGKVAIPDNYWIVMRVLRHRFGKPVRATMVWFQFNSKGKMVTVRHKEANEFYLKGFTLDKVYKRGKEPLSIEYQRERKIWW